MNGKELLELAEVKRVPLRDGDILAIYCPRKPNDQEAYEMQERIKAVTGLDIKIVVLPPGFDLEITSPEEKA